MMNHTSLKNLMGSAAMAAVLAISTPSIADELMLVMPSHFSGDAKELERAVWQVFAHKTGPGDSFSVWDGTLNKRVTKITVPDDSRYESLKRKKRKFGRELGKIGQHFKTMASNASAPAGRLDILSVLRGAGANRLDAASPIHVLLIGAPVQVTDDVAWSMVSAEATLQVPTDAAIAATDFRTPYSVTGHEDALKGIYVHLCGVDDIQRTKLQDMALHHVWGNWIAAQGGHLVTWADDVAVCAERFGAKLTKPTRIATLNATLPPAMIQPVWNVADDDDGEGRLEPSRFNLFFYAKHPTVKGLTVSTGVEYTPKNYPARYNNAWCSFTSAAGPDGVHVRVPVADKLFGKAPVNGTVTDKHLKAAGVTRADFKAARTVCRFPSDGE